MQAWGHLAWGLRTADSQWHGSRGGREHTFNTHPWAPMIRLPVLLALAHDQCPQTCHQPSEPLTLMPVGAKNPWVTLGAIPGTGKGQGQTQIMSWPWHKGTVELWATAQDRSKVSCWAGYVCEVGSSAGAPGERKQQGQPREGRETP